MHSFTKNLTDYLSDYSVILSSVFKKDDITEIIYGSALEGNKSKHDVDVCIIVPHYEQSQVKLISEAVVDLHSKYGFRLDFDVPYENKTLYSFLDVKRALSGQTFYYGNKKFEISPIVMTPDFLGSPKMKDRLLLNVLTTNNQLLVGDAELFNRLVGLSWGTIIRVVFSNIDNIAISKHEFINYLGGDNISGKKYKGYLGYNLDNIATRRHLIEAVDIFFADFAEKKVLFINNEGKYACDETWIQSLFNDFVLKI